MMDPKQKTRGLRYSAHIIKCIFLRYCELFYSVLFLILFCSSCFWLTGYELCSFSCSSPFLSSVLSPSGELLSPPMGGTVSGQGQGDVGRVHSAMRQVSHFAHLFFMFHKLYTVGQRQWRGSVWSTAYMCVCVRTRVCACMCETFLQGHRAQGAWQRLMTGGDNSISILREWSSVIV